jgi:protein tyrosine/serine phosphatase
MSARVHAFEGVENFRDFGDYDTAAGRRLRRGRLLRSGHHARATDADLERMAALGVNVVVDLRRAAERREQPSRRPIGFSGRVIESSDHELQEPPHIAFLRNADLTEASVRRFMLDTYRAMPFDERHLELFRSYFEALAAGEGAVLIHCAAGKDRTGLLAALTHHAAGVGRDDLMEDYLLTNIAVRPVERAPEIGRRIEEAYGRKATEAAIRAFLGVEPDYLETALAEIDARCGSLEAYLVDALRVDRPFRDRLHAQLTL